MRIYLITMVVLAWAAVLSGAYAIYPWYRAAPPPGTVDLSMFPQHLWAILEWSWRNKTVAAKRISAIALALLVLSLITDISARR